MFSFNSKSSGLFKIPRIENQVIVFSSTFVLHDFPFVIRCLKGFRTSP